MNLILTGFVFGNEKVRTRSTATRDRNLQLWGNFSTGFVEFSPVDLFSVSQGFMCKFVGNRPKMWRKLPDFQAQNPVTSVAVVGFLFPKSHTVCGCRALMVGKQGFAQGKILRVCGEIFQGVHGSCHPN